MDVIQQLFTLKHNEKEKEKTTYITYINAPNLLLYLLFMYSYGLVILIEFEIIFCSNSYGQ